MTTRQSHTGVAVATGLAVVALFFIINNPFLMFGVSQADETTPQGQLVIQDEVIGGGATAAIGDQVLVHYTGKLQNGVVFDTSLGRTPYLFVLGAGDVIPGWELGIAGMREGGKRLLIIPPDLGYGASGLGPVPGNATLVFEVELVDIVSGQ